MRYRPTDHPWEHVLDRLVQLDHRCAVVGPHGAGKSQCLMRLGRHLQNGGFDCRLLPLTMPRPSIPTRKLHRLLRSLRGGDILLIDSAETLPRRQRRMLAKTPATAGGIIITAHEETTLPTLIRCRTTVALFEELLSELLPVESFPPSGVTAALFERCQGNVREAFFLLYDVWAGRLAAEELAAD